MSHPRYYTIYYRCLLDMETNTHYMKTEHITHVFNESDSQIIN